MTSKRKDRLLFSVLHAWKEFLSYGNRQQDFKHVHVRTESRPVDWRQVEVIPEQRHQTDGEHDAGEEEKDNMQVVHVIM